MATLGKEGEWLANFIGFCISAYGHLGVTPCSRKGGKGKWLVVPDSSKILSDSVGSFSCRFGLVAVAGIAAGSGRQKQLCRRFGNSILGFSVWSIVGASRQVLNFIWCGVTDIPTPFSLPVWYDVAGLGILIADWWVDSSFVVIKHLDKFFFYYLFRTSFCFEINTETE